LEGDLPNGWLWETSVSHGTSETVTYYQGSPKLRQYLDIVRSPNYGVNFRRTGIDEAASGAGRCTSGLPLWRDFRQTPVSQDCMDSLLADMQFTSQIIMNTADANIAGDLLTMPAGELRFSLGAGYTQFKYESTVDPLNDVFTYTEEVIGQRAQEATRGKINVTELYGELLIPLVSDVPGVRHLDLEVGARVSDYSTSGNVKTFKALLDWSFNDWARLRGGYNRATRAPHVGELFQGQTNGFFGNMTDGDPCSRNNDLPTYGAGLGNPDPANREAVVQLCRDMMTAAGQWNFYDSRTIADEPARPGGQPAARPHATVLFGNPNIQPETADTWTAGLVMTSPFSKPWAENLSVTLDWYSIELTDIIAQQNVAELWRQCMLSLDASSPECSVVHRDATDGGAIQTDITYSNQGYAKFTGFDAQVNWRAQFADIGLGFIPGSISINSLLTVPRKRITQASPQAPRIENVGTLRCDLGLNCSGYDYSVFTTFNYFNGNLGVSLRWNYYPSIDAVSVATNPTSRDRGVFESYNLFSLNASYMFNDKLTLRGGIDNLFNTEPPLSGGSYAADGGWVGAVAPAFPTKPAYSSSATYDQFGRRFYIGLSANF
jgi:iron complex outermembrane receptor protein